MTAALGFRAHSGWAVLVAVLGKSAILRRRFDIAGNDVPKQPFHEAAEMEIQDAEGYIRNSERGSVQMAVSAVKLALQDLRAKGHDVRRAAVLLGSGKPLPELSKILAAHPLIHTAEGVFFREILRKACRECGLEVSGIPERELLGKISAPEIAAMGKALGPPWTQDEKLATAAALTLL